MYMLEKKDERVIIKAKGVDANTLKPEDFKKMLREQQVQASVTLS